MTGETTAAPRVLVATADPAFAAAAKAALSHRFELDFCERIADEVVQRGGSQDIAILEYAGFHAEAARAFERVSKQHVKLPLLLALLDPPAGLAIELLRCGVTDIVLLPADEDVLLRKTVRAVLDAIWPAIPVPGLSEEPPVLARKYDEGDGPQRRRSFRVDLDGTRSAWIAVARGQQRLRFYLRDLSIGQDTWHGGLSFRVPDRHRAEAPFDRLAPGSHLAAWIYLEGGREAIPVDFSVRRIREIQGGVDLAGQYRATHLQDERLIRRFWVTAQRRQRGAM